jgi:hypothetical protein
MSFRCLFRGRCLETNVDSEPFASNGSFSGPTVLALRKYATLLRSYWFSMRAAFPGIFIKVSEVLVKCIKLFDGITCLHFPLGQLSLVGPVSW